MFSTGRHPFMNRMYAVLCENLSGTCPMLHESGLSSIWKDVKFSHYILLFVLSYSNSYFIMLFAIRSFLTEIHKEPHIIFLSLQPNEEHLVYWILRDLCLFAKMEDIGKVTLSHTEASLFNFKIFCYVCACIGESWAGQHP